MPEEYRGSYLAPGFRLHWGFIFFSELLAAADRKASHSHGAHLCGSEFAQVSVHRCRSGCGCRQPDRCQVQGARQTSHTRCDFAKSCGFGAHRPIVQKKVAVP